MQKGQAILLAALRLLKRTELFFVEPLAAAPNSNL